MLIAAATWLAALNYSVNLAYALAFWVVSATVIAALLSIRQLLGLRLQVGLPQEVFAGELAVASVALDAKDMRSRMLIVRFVNEQSVQSHLSEQDLNTLFSHDAQNTQVQLKVPTHHRGYEQLPLIQLISTAPFGLLEVSVVCECHERFIVYPAPQSHTVAVTGRFIDAQEGQHRQTDGDEVAYLKGFVDGQSLQSIAWKQYAKTGNLLSKHFEQAVAVRPDVISYKDYPNIHSRDQLASLLCHRILEQMALQQPFILELPQKQIVPQVQQRQLCLNALAVL